MAQNRPNHGGFNQNMPKITCKTCRRLGFSVCGKEKCAFKRKPYSPGIHGRKKGGFKRRSNQSEYGNQLKEKQKVKFLYGLREKQFRNLVAKAIAAKSAETSRRIVELLETRLDNVVYRLGFASSRKAARQIVNHGHIMVNGKKTNIPSRALKIGQQVSVRPQSLGLGIFRDLDLRLKKHQVPSWLNLKQDQREGHIVAFPSAEEVDTGANLNSIIEFYSR